MSIPRLPGALNTVENFQMVIVTKFGSANERDAEEAKRADKRRMTEDENFEGIVSRFAGQTHNVCIIVPKSLIMK